MNKKLKENLKEKTKQSKEVRFFQLDKILKYNKPINIIVTATGTRKTTQLAIWAKDQVKKGKYIVWIRRRKDDILNTVVDLFRRIFSEDKDFLPRFDFDMPAVVTSRGCKVTTSEWKQRGGGVNSLAIHFIPLSLYYKYKGLTGLADKLAGIVYDEAIPMENEWIGGDPKEEEKYFMRLVNICARDEKIPIFFLCNPNILGSWMIQKWFPDFRPDPKKEKLELKNEALIYSMPWLGNDRGTIEYFETEEEKKVTKQGIFHEKEYSFLTKEKAKKYICSLIIGEGQREIEIGRKDNIFIISEPTKRPDKKLICFRRSNLINYKGNIRLGDKRYYMQWLTNLWARGRLYFSNAGIKTFLENNIDREFSW